MNRYKKKSFSVVCIVASLCILTLPLNEDYPVAWQASLTLTVSEIETYIIHMKL